MQNHDGDDANHKLTGKGAPDKFDSLKKAFCLDAKSKWWVETMHKRWLEMLPSSVDSTGVTLMCWWALVIMVTDVIGRFTLETKDRLFVSIIFLFLFIGLVLDYFRKSSGPLTKANMSLLANKIQQKRRLFYWLQLVSAWICVVLSMMGVYSQYYGQIEATNMVTIHHINLRFFYLMTIGICAINFVKIIIIMRPTVTDEMFEGAMDQSEDMHMELMKDQSARIPRGSKRRHAY